MTEKVQNEIKRRKDGGVEAPISLLGFFNEENSDKEEENEEDPHKEEETEEKEEKNVFEQIFDEQKLEICLKSFIIRQYCWHMANANKVWPGTFNLAEFITNHSNRFSNGNILELGAATGALSIYLQSSFSNYKLITSDIDDGGEVQSNIEYNFIRNGLIPPQHISHTWGTEWPWEKLVDSNSNVRYIIASDILLYVSAYPALVQTLLTLFRVQNNNTNNNTNNNNNSINSSINSSNDGTTIASHVINVITNPQSILYSLYDEGSEYFYEPFQSETNELNNTNTDNTHTVEFLMSWNRRISESHQFFYLMKLAGFQCYHHGKCIYSFVYPHNNR